MWKNVTIMISVDETSDSDEMKKKESEDEQENTKKNNIAPIRVSSSLRYFFFSRVRGGYPRNAGVC